LYVKVPTNLRDFFNQEGVLLLTSKVPLVADKSKEMSAISCPRQIMLLAGWYACAVIPASNSQGLRQQLTIDYEPPI